DPCSSVAGVFCLLCVLCDSVVRTLLHWQFRGAQYANSSPSVSPCAQTSPSRNVNAGRFGPASRVGGMRAGLTPAPTCPPGRATPVQNRRSSPSVSRTHSLSWQPTFRPTCGTTEKCSRWYRPALLTCASRPPVATDEAPPGGEVVVRPSIDADCAVTPIA